MGPTYQTQVNVTTTADAQMRGLAPEYLCSRFQTNSTLPNYARTRGWNNVHLRWPNTDWYKKSFQYIGAKDWNSLMN